MTEVVLTADRTAAAINGLAADIGDWAKRKGFREDYDDADFLEEFAQDFAIIDYDSLQLDGINVIRERLGKIADSHRRLTNVSKLMLMVSELSEALEGMRDGGNYGEELGDLVIRVLENADANRIPIGDEVTRKMAKNQDRPYKHGRQF